MREKNKINAVAFQVTEEEIKTQLKEECAELIQALCKHDRLSMEHGCVNKTEQEVRKMINEEIADVLLCIEVLKAGSDLYDLEEVEKIKRYKLDRWLGRINRAGGAKNAGSKDFQ